MQTCSFCLREISEYISFCFYCNKSVNIAFLKLPDPELSYFLLKVKEAENFDDLDLFEYLSKKTIRIDLKEDVEIQSTEEIARPIQEEIKESHTICDQQENIELEKEKKVDSKTEQGEKDTLEEAYFSIVLEEDVKQGATETVQEEIKDNKILFGSDLEDSQYFSISQVLSQRQKTTKKIAVPEAQIPENTLSANSQDLPKQESLSEDSKENGIVFSFENFIPENCGYLLFEDYPKGEAEILGRCQEEKFPYMFFTEPKKASVPENNKSFLVWVILFIGIVLGIFIGRLF